MKGQKAFWSGNLFGLKELPTESGAWGILLPPPHSKERTHEPDAAEWVEEINAQQLRFDTREFSEGDRGFLFVTCFPMAIWALVLTVVFSLRLVSSIYVSWWESLVIVLIFFFVFCVSCVITAYRSVYRPLREPIILSKKLRRFYVWADEKQGWQHWDYDSLVPFTHVNKLVTTSGATTVFILRLAEIDPVTRKVIRCISPAPGQRDPAWCGSIWEFIRQYMDGKPEDLPPVRFQPSIHDRKADLVRFDRKFLGFITADHRFEKAWGLFGPFYFGFQGLLFYWSYRASAWISRRAPRPAMPAELVAALQGDGPNPYRFLPLSEDEKLAWSGDLPRLKHRWQIVAVISTLFHGAVVAFMLAVVLMVMFPGIFD